MPPKYDPCTDLPNMGGIGWIDSTSAPKSHPILEESDRARATQTADENDDPLAILWAAYERAADEQAAVRNPMGAVERLLDLAGIAMGQIPPLRRELLALRQFAKNYDQARPLRDLRNHEVAEILGRSTSWVRRQPAAVLPHYRLNGHERRYRRADVEALAERRGP